MATPSNQVSSVLSVYSTSRKFVCALWRATLATTTVAKALMGLLLENSLSTKTDFKSSSVTCPLCQTDETADLKTRSKVWRTRANEAGSPHVDGTHRRSCLARDRLDLAQWSHRDLPHRAADDQTLANHDSLFRINLGRCPVAIGDFHLLHLVKGHARDKQPRNKRPTDNATSRRTGTKAERSVCLPILSRRCRSETNVH